jgi:hypothetical protein
MRSIGVGEGLRLVERALIYPNSLRSLGPFLPPHAVEDIGRE